MIMEQWTFSIWKEVDYMILTILLALVICHYIKYGNFKRMSDKNG